MAESPATSSLELIRTAGLRVTRQRVAVLDAVQATPHASAAAVLAEVAGVVPGISHQAVYDGLADLAAAGLLRRIAVTEGGPALFETRTRDNHHHCVCRACGTVVDVDCAVGAAPCLAASDAAGFVIDEAEVIYRGLCAPCAAAAGNVPPPSQQEKSNG
jgi:Fur family ferric uptake transcriptional regulator